MPELPEVETIRSQLSETLPFTIEAAEESAVIGSLTGKSQRHFSPKGMSLVKIERKGKLMDLHFVDNTRGAKTLNTIIMGANHDYFPDAGVVNADGKKQSHIRQTTGLAYGFLRFKN